MTRNALAHVGSYVVIIAGLLVPAASYAANSNSPYDQGGANPAQSNCDSKTGCASYSTGDRTRARPAHSSSRASRAEENRKTAELNQQQLAGRNSQ
ncbi:MAG TPA: hypothetical protein VGF92_02330 [Stellaceae bacterium]|jgi:hypothetical protein